MLNYLKWFFNKESWTLKEVCNQFVHLIISLFVSTISMLIFKELYLSIILGILIGAIIEYYQYQFKNEKDIMQIYDHFRDFSFYCLGSTIFILMLITKIFFIIFI
jgi:hypothetical protein